MLQTFDKHELFELSRQLNHIAQQVTLRLKCMFELGASIKIFQCCQPLGNGNWTLFH